MLEGLTPSLYTIHRKLIKIFGDDKLPELSDSDTWLRGYQTT